MQCCQPGTRRTEGGEWWQAGESKELRRGGMATNLRVVGGAARSPTTKLF